MGTYHTFFVADEGDLDRLFPGWKPVKPQTPLLPYINGPFLALDDYSLRSQRLINLIWGAGALGAVVALLYRYSSSWRLAGLAALVLVSCPHWVAQQGLGKAYAAAGCFLMLAAWAALGRGGF